MTAVIERPLATLTLLGFTGCALGLWLEPRVMLSSYLEVWFTIAAIPIGAIGVLLTSYLVRAGWTPDLREPLTRAALTVPMAAVLFIPVLAGLSLIYPWAADFGSLPAFKAVYLTPWFFALRAVVYFVLFTALAVWAARAYGNDAAMTRAASAGLIVWSLVVSLAGIDWLESIEPHFHSSIYGLLVISFVLLSAYAFGLVVLLAFRRSQQMSNASYGGVLLALLLLWAYLHAMQYIIIWTGNIPDEVTWYLMRLKGGWAYALWAMFIGQFVLPFFALLSARIRSSTISLLWLAGSTLLLRLVEAVVLILPPRHPLSAVLLLDISAATLAVGGSWLLAWDFAPALWERWSRRAAAARQHQ
jgi:hypothetical protein